MLLLFQNFHCFFVSAKLNVRCKMFCPLTGKKINGSKHALHLPCTKAILWVEYTCYLYAFYFCESNLISGFNVFTSFYIYQSFFSGMQLFSDLHSEVFASHDFFFKCWTTVFFFLLSLCIVLTWSTYLSEIWLFIEHLGVIDSFTYHSSGCLVCTSHHPVGVPLLHFKPLSVALCQMACLLI